MSCKFYAEEACLLPPSVYRGRVLSLCFGDLQSRGFMGVLVSQSLMMRQAWGPCRRSSTGSRTLGTHAKVLSGHPAEGVHIPTRRGSTDVGGRLVLGSVYERQTSSLHLPSCAWCSRPLASFLSASPWQGWGWEG